MLEALKGAVYVCHNHNMTHVCVSLLHGVCVCILCVYICVCAPSNLYATTYMQCVKTARKEGWPDIHFESASTSI